MAVETILFFDDKLHVSNLLADITSATSTEIGYNAEFIRDPDFQTAWKPNNGTSDEYIQLDLGESFGVNGETVNVAVAYDARNSDQLFIRVIGDDTGAGPWTERALFTIPSSARSGPTASPTCIFGSWVVGATPDRHFRIEQLYSGGGHRSGTRTAKITGVSFYTPTGRVSLDSQYSGREPSPGAYIQVFPGGDYISSGGAPYMLADSLPVQGIDLNIKGASPTQWRDFVSRLHKHGGPHRTFYMRFEGMKNLAQSNFQMVRLFGDGWTANRPVVDTYDCELRLVTVGAM